ASLTGSVTGSRAILNLTFRAPYSPGTGSINSSGTVALADGSGTQVNGGGNTATYTISSPPPPADPVPNAVTITSPTNPSQDVWYKNTEITFNWNKEDKVDGFSYIFDQSPESVPDDTAETADTSVSYNSLPEGAVFFHIKAHNNMGWGPVSHYKVSFDR